MEVIPITYGTFWYQILTLLYPYVSTDYWDFGDSFVQFTSLHYQREVTPAECELWGIALHLTITVHLFRDSLSNTHYIDGITSTAKLFIYTSLLEIEVH